MSAAPIAIAPFRIGNSSTVILTDADTLRADFERARAIGVADGFVPALLDDLVETGSSSAYEVFELGSLGAREIEEPERVGVTLRAMLMRPEMLRWVERTTGCGRLAEVSGRVAQTRPGTGQALDWHTDRGDPRRRLAVTINLSDAPYEGGLFELRTMPAQEPLAVHHHREAGSMLIFQIGRGLEHRLLPVTSGGPRRVFAGWFMAPDESGPVPGVG